MKQNELERLLSSAAHKLGTTPEQLKQGAVSGDIDAMLNQMDPAEAQNLRRVLSDRKAAQEILQSPEAQELMKRLRSQ